MFLRTGNDTAEARERIAAVDERVQTLRRSLGSTPSSGDARVRLDLAWTLCWRGEYRPAMDLIEPLTAAGFPRDIAFEAQQMIGDNHFRHDQYDLASKLYHENLDRARSSGEHYWGARAEEGIAFSLIEVGHYTTGEFEEAGRIFERLLQLYRRLDIAVREGVVLYGLSRATAGMGDYARAIDLANESVTILRNSGGEHLLQLPLLQLANVQRDRGDLQEAGPLYEIAIDAADLSQDISVQLQAAYSYGTLLHYLNQTNVSIELWRSILGIAKDLEFPRIGHEVSRRLANVAAERGEFEDAYHFQLTSEEYGNQVGIMSSVLQNQQLLLREQIHQTAQLEDTLNNLKAGVEASLDGIFVLEVQEKGIDQDEFVIRYVNDSAALMLDQKRSSLVHVLAKSAWRSASSDHLLEPSLAVYQSGDPFEFESIQLDFVPGAARWYSVKIAKIPNGVVWTVSDITERQELQLEILAQRDRLSEANERLTALDREKSEMLGIAAHDLRSPIGSIRSLCELIETDDPDTRDLVKTIEEVSDSLLALIGNLLDVERIERGEIELKLANLDAGPLTAHLISQFAADARQKRIEIDLAVPEGPTLVHADESALNRILQNLISNALKFSPPGSPVSIRVCQTDTSVRIEIQDRGKGISEADRKKLFSKFAKLSTRPTAGESSTGLGLSIVKSLVEAMHGQVGCDSQPGKGATFWVELPRVAIAEKAA